MEEQTKDLKDYLAALRRRKKPVLTAIGVLAVASVLVAFLLPSAYRSTATILIEEQEIPPELVRSTITSFADQRVQVISQQVMTRANMMQIVDKYKLYASKRKTETNEEILERMREDVKFSMVSANVIDRRSGMKTMATIAFTLSFDGETPAIAQQVASELTSLYLNENLKNRQQKSSETSAFLSQDAEKLNQHIADIETKLAAFKEKNWGRLPELTPLNMQMRDRTDSEIMEVDRQLKMLEERKFFLQSQLAQIKPNTPMISAGGERILDSSERLKTLQSMYASMSGVYSSEHPDLVKMRREMESLKKAEGAGPDDTQEQAKQITRMHADLAAMQDKYSDDHPDVVKLKKSIAALEEAHKKSLTDPREPKFKKPENPAYISLQSQLEETNSELKTMREKRGDLKAKISDYEARIEATPQVEREYLDLNRERENSVRRYQEIKAKLMDAQVGQQMEKDSKGERFTLIDPAQLPEKPHSPNRPVLLLLGLFLSLGGGVAYGSLLESLDDSIRSPREFSRLLEVPMLSVIPYIENWEDVRKKTKFRNTAVTSVLAGFSIVVLLIHFLWMPLDVLWYTVLRKMDTF